MVTAITPAARTVIRVIRNPWRIPTIPGRRKRNNQGFDTDAENVLKQNTHEKTHQAAFTQSVRREIAATASPAAQDHAISRNVWHSSRKKPNTSAAERTPYSQKPANGSRVVASKSEI
jgi:hypothetical protein